VNAVGFFGAIITGLLSMLIVGLFDAALGGFVVRLSGSPDIGAMLLLSLLGIVRRKA